MGNEGELTLLSMLEIGGPIVWFMVFSSVLVLGITFERWFYLSSFRRMLRRLDSGVMEAARKGQMEEARRLCEPLSPPLRELFTNGLDRALGRVKGLPEMAFQRGRRKVLGELKSRVWLLGTFGALLPFMGLFGTVVGVMASFEAIGQTGTGGFAVVSAGIAEALIATAVGLFVALEAMFAYNTLQQMISRSSAELGLLVDELVEILRVQEAGRAGAA